MGKGFHSRLIAVFSAALLLEVQPLLCALGLTRAAIRTSIPLLLRDEGFDLLNLPGKVLGLLGQLLRLVQVPRLHRRPGLPHLGLVAGQQVVQLLLQFHVFTASSINFWSSNAIKADNFFFRAISVSSPPDVSESDTFPVPSFSPA